MAVIFNFLLFSFLLSFTDLKSNNDINIYPSPKLKLNENAVLAEIRNFIEYLRSNPDEIFNIIYMNDTIKNFAEKYNISFINPMIDNFLFNKTCKFINDSYEVISHNYSNTNALDYIINILDYIERNNTINMSIIFYEMHKYVNYPGMDKIINYYKEYSNFTLLFLERVMNSTKFPNLYSHLYYLLFNYDDKLFQLAYNFLKDFIIILIN